MNTDREHLDAETVAAWIDGGLDAAALAAAEAHASNCERCQMLLATTARTLPAEGASTAHDTRTTFGFWKWLAPFAAAAAAVTIWMVVPQESMRPERQAAPQSDVAAAPSPIVPVAPPVIPERAARAAPPATADQLAESRRDAPAPKAEAKEQLAEAQTNATGADAFRDRQLKREDARAEAAAAAAPAAPPTPAPPPPAEPARDAAAAGATLGAVAQSRLQKQSGPLEIVAPGSQRRWRVLADLVEYSQDGGRNWVPVRLTAGDVITAGISPAAQVCWLVGNRGVVLLATDGTNFTRLPFPERVDLIAVTATDARRATVTTADGRTFQTDDNGRNWRNP